MKYTILRLVFFLFAVSAVAISVLMLIAGKNIMTGADLKPGDFLTPLSNALVYLTLAHMLKRWGDRDDDKRVEAYEERIKEDREKEKSEASEK